MNRKEFLTIVNKINKLQFGNFEDRLNNHIKSELKKSEFLDYVKKAGFEIHHGRIKKCNFEEKDIDYMYNLLLNSYDDKSEYFKNIEKLKEKYNCDWDTIQRSIRKKYPGYLSDFKSTKIVSELEDGKIIKLYEFLKKKCKNGKGITDIPNRELYDDLNLLQAYDKINIEYIIKGIYKPKSMLKITIKGA